MTPPAKAGGFSGNGTSNPHRWRLKAPSKPLSLEQHVACSIRIATQRQSTGWTHVPALAERLGYKDATLRAALCGAGRVHRHQGPSSFFHFDSQDVQELAPASIVYGLCQHRAGQSFDV